MKALLAALVLLIAADQSSNADAVLATLDQYLMAYEPKLSELVADENMQQEIRHGRLRLSRYLASEVAFIALPQGVGWLGIRHVKTVNTTPVSFADESLATVLRAPGLEAARALLAESAKHNLGLRRTTNLPNLPLEFLHPRNRTRFITRLDGQETIRGVRTSRVVFLERITPTLIRNPDKNTDRPSVVRAWIDPRNGRLLRAEVSTFASFDAKDYENNIRVEFAENGPLDMLVPSEMREVFPGDEEGVGTSVARYTNFRRFTTSARIVQ